MFNLNVRTVWTNSNQNQQPISAKNNCLEEMAIPSFASNVQLNKVRDFSVPRSTLTLQLLLPFWVTRVVLMTLIVREMCTFFVLCQTVEEKNPSIRGEMRREHSQQQQKGYYTNNRPVKPGILLRIAAKNHTSGCTVLPHYVTTHNTYLESPV